MLKHLLVFFITIFTIWFGACAAKQQFQYQTSSKIKPLLQKAPAYPNTRFVTLSDLHFYDKTLGVSGTAFHDYMIEDRKLLVQSDEILTAAINNIIKEKVDFILISGDLTKDGEKICHQGVVKALTRLASSGTKVYVIPGNHDINNGESLEYSGNTTKPVQNITEKDFMELYQAFGYQEAISKDPDSLSYVVEPVKGLRVLALDSNRWKENKPGHEPPIDGAFSPATLHWIEAQLIQAKKESSPVIALMHHGIMEHFPANEKYYGEYIVDDDILVSELLAVYGVRLVFTGHFHAQDITKKTFAGSGTFIFDIETGSLATAPCPYRIIQLSNGGTASIKSKFIKTIPSQENFAEYAYDHVFNSTINLANAKLDKFFVSKEQQALITGQIAKAYCAHLYGDEKRPGTTIDNQGFGLWLRFVTWFQEDLIDGWWTDLEPKDNDVTINLLTGESS